MKGATVPIAKMRTQAYALLDAPRPGNARCCPEVSVRPQAAGSEGEEARARRPVGSWGCPPAVAETAEEAGQGGNERLNFPETVLTT